VRVTDLDLEGRQAGVHGVSEREFVGKNEPLSNCSI